MQTLVIGLWGNYFGASLLVLRAVMGSVLVVMAFLSGQSIANCDVGLLFLVHITGIGGALLSGKIVESPVVQAVTSHHG